MADVNQLKSCALHSVAMQLKFKAKLNELFELQAQNNNSPSNKGKPSKRQLEELSPVDKRTYKIM